MITQEPQVPTVLGGAKQKDTAHLVHCISKQLKFV